jgi:two-component system sensor histidine kinase QseC
MSIRYHLIIRLLIASTLIVGGAAWFGYNDVKHETRELFDAQLASSARLLLSLVQADSGDINLSSIQKHLDQNQLQTVDLEDEDGHYREHDEDNETLAAGHIYETKLGFQIWDNEGNLLLNSANLPITKISDQTSGFSDSRILDNDWRVFSIQSIDGGYRCVTAERIDVRNDLIGKIFSDLLMLFILLVPTLALTMWFTINRGLAPLHKLAAQINHRGAEKLDSVSEQNMPTEIQTISAALNQLLARLKSAFTREKRITSDAAHELRTPLAAVKLHAQLAQSATNKADRQGAIDQVLRGIDRTSHLVDQLLALARLEPDSFTTNLEPQVINRLIIEEAALLAPFANKKDIELSFLDSPALTANIDETSLRLLIRNLVNNAITYTHHNGKVDIRLYAEADRAYITIEDNGPGIPESEYERVFERFYRIENYDTPGCGIGLSIVQRVAELHKATLNISTPDSGNGLKVTIGLLIASN